MELQKYMFGHTIDKSPVHYLSDRLTYNESAVNKVKLQIFVNMYITIIYFQLNFLEWQDNTYLENLWHPKQHYK